MTRPSRPDTPAAGGKSARRKSAPRLAPATISESDGVRFLHLDTPWVQGAMRIRKPALIELEYVQRMMAWMLLREPSQMTAGHAVQLGLGAAAITRFCHAALGMRTTAVEINPSVIAACRLWFRLPDDDARLSVVRRDAADWAADPAHAGTADVLCVDLYDHEAASPVLDSEAFYRDCHRLLADAGVMTVNLFGRAASFRRSARHLGAAFGAGTLWMISPTREGNTIVVAVKGVRVPGRAQLAERAENIETRFGLPACKWLRYWKPVDLRTQVDFSLDTSSSFAPIAAAAESPPSPDSSP